MIFGATDPADHGTVIAAGQRCPRFSTIEHSRADEASHTFPYTSGERCMVVVSLTFR